MVDLWLICRLEGEQRTHPPLLNTLFFWRDPMDSKPPKPSLYRWCCFAANSEECICHVELLPNFSNERFKESLWKSYTSFSEAGVKTLVCSSKNKPYPLSKKDHLACKLWNGICLLSWNLVQASVLIWHLHTFLRLFEASWGQNRAPFPFGKQFLAPFPLQRASMKCTPSVRKLDRYNRNCLRENTKKRTAKTWSWTW